MLERDLICTLKHNEAKNEKNVNHVDFNNYSFN